MAPDVLYFYRCRSCDHRDSGTPVHAYQCVDCPSCGGQVDRWPAQPNVTREWSHCMDRGHVWEPLRGATNTEACAVCGAQRKF